MKGGKSKAETKKTDNKLSVKKRGAGSEKAGNKPAKKGKAANDPNKPKRPASAFFVFMEDFRKQYKEKHPKNKSVAAVGKAGGDKWKSLSEAAEGPAEDDESDKSKSEVNDEDEDDDESGEEEEDDD
ncbi:high mobility group B3 [Actinidia rufa]|uniref:High mobility group B3 n=1 Tax=Actinidia rufa TaxID=165716 RepID=A0A7J0DP13_9ERIC|nr:high mobility group B3 [Actinidia rufa]